MMNLGYKPGVKDFNILLNCKFINPVREGRDRTPTGFFCKKVNFPEFLTRYLQKE